MSGSGVDLIDIDDDNLGYVKLFRKLEKWEWYTDIPVKVLFIHCLIRARHYAINWKGLCLEQGQFPTGISALSVETGLTYSQVRTALEKLVLTKEIATRTTSKGTVVTVNNYSIYHGEDSDSNEPIADGSQTDRKQIANGSQTNRKQIANKSQLLKKGKKGKKDKKDKKGKKEEEELIYPDCVERTLIDKYFQNRIDIKKTMSHNAKELFLKKVQKFHDKGQDVKTLIEKAIIAGWSDIYEANDYGKRKDYPGSKRIPVEKAKTKSEGKRSFVPGLETTITVIGKKGKHQRGQETSLEVVEH